jgi:hypothetical protein
MPQRFVEEIDVKKKLGIEAKEMGEFAEDRWMETSRYVMWVPV